MEPAPTLISSPRKKQKKKLTQNDIEHRELQRICQAMQDKPPSQRSSVNQTPSFPPAYFNNQSFSKALAGQVSDFDDSNQCVEYLSPLDQNRVISINSTPRQESPREKKQ
jgi:hypothetical protein